MINAISERLRGLVSLFWREVAKFGLVGGVAFVVDSAVFVGLLNGPLHSSEVWAKSIATVVASIFSWVANRYWTFRHRKQANVVREAILFAIMNGVGLLIAAGCVAFTKYILLMTDKVSIFVAGSIVGLVLGTIFRFFAYRFWVFNVELDAEPGYEGDHEIFEPHPTAAVAAAKPGGPGEQSEG
ncbi:GtrA family protein [Sinomonas sp. JGH33]|uniref:GtrA family protein n=1 Tax=Sinomonas terricola TaxID=3110330 RepID=A0ABU5T958_9MICC|nr:GtrA family protein [Sinomonas sp. JGH33]MEA5456202.1 GtrA family protein [Sinomonas sp. JGH33]